MSGEIREPLVSIILNCYNGEKYLKDALDSVYSQIYKNWEIIFWDNQSTDNSENIAKSYDSRIYYHRSTEHTNLGKARNLAINLAKGKYIAFIDCDDIWLPNKLSEQVEMMEMNPRFILSYAGVEEIFLNGKKFRDVPTIYQSGFIFNKLLKQFDIPILTTIINNELLQENKILFDPLITASEEYCLFMQLACVNEIGVSEKILAKYRVHSNSLTSNSISKLSFERRYTLNKIMQNHPNIYIKYQDEFKEAFARANYYDSRFHMMNSNKFKAFESLKPVAFINVRYFILTILTLTSLKLWNWVHFKFRNRA